MYGAYNKGLIDSSQWQASRQMLWKELHGLLLARANSDTEVYQSLEVVKKFYNQGLIDSTQSEETRKELAKR
jgi:hypothetical protein